MNSETVRDYKDDVVQRVNCLMLPDSPMAEGRQINLKRKINSLLWEELPSETAMADAEIIACRIFEMINK